VVIFFQQFPYPRLMNNWSSCGVHECMNGELSF
jgi:hypothetical protein